MRRYIRTLLARAHRALKTQPDPELVGTIRAQQDLLNEAARRESRYRQDYVERAAELIEARQMAGGGPWLAHETTRELGLPTTHLRESTPITAQGAYGDIDLALQNVEWRREINLSWLEFSRWGIQQIILISRLYYIKNPLIRRLIDVAAYYVFGRGVEVSSPDETANEILEDFFERNKATLGQIALVDLERRKYYDGNLFFCFFADKVNTGECNVRTIDATEIMDIITDPDDVDTHWYYKRSWTQKDFNLANGQTSTSTKQAYYPALNYEPSVQPKTINGYEVKWGNPVYHRKCGAVAKWHFGAPIIYPALDWAKAGKKYLEHCATVNEAYAQYAYTITTKGGQQAMEGIKQQLQTTVGPDTALWDQNPPPVNASYFVSGPGTTIEPMKTRGAGSNPEEVRQYKLMCCMVVGVPETFLADVSTGNLATATTLDRPTELCFMEKQEAWQDDLCVIAKYVLQVSQKAPSGKLQEAKKGSFRIKEARKVRKGGRLLMEATATPDPGDIEVAVNFPAIREGDLPQLVAAVVDSMTLGNRAGQIVGIDEKEGVKKLFDINGIENGDEIAEKMFPDSSYEYDRSKQQLEAPIKRPDPLAGGQPKLQQEAARQLAKILVQTINRHEANGVHK